MASQVPHDEVQTPDVECRTAEGEERVQESGPRYSAFRLPPEVAEPIEAAAREARVEVYHAEFSGRELRVQVEAAAGTSVDTCTDFSRALVPRLDAVNFMHRQYTLEVSSPGIERKLYQPQDFPKAVGKHVKLLVRGGWVEGVLESADANGVSICVEKNGKASHESTKPTKRPEPSEAQSASGPSVSSWRTFSFAEIREAQIRVPDCELFTRSHAERN
jgi:ribosome maturation factor RimP